jgi:hypothetical protein
MPRFILAILACMLCFASHARAQPISDNAALYYWQAIAALPAYDKDDQKCLEDFNSATMDQARKLVGTLPPSLRLMQRGASISPVAWAIPYESEGLNTLLPHLGRTRELARLATLRIRFDLAERRYDQGIAMAVDTIRMARHVGNNESVIAVLVEYSIESMVLDALNAQLRFFPAAEAAKLGAALKSLPPRSSMASAIAAEKKYVVAWLRLQIQTGKLREIVLLLASQDEKPAATLAAVIDTDLPKLFQNDLPGLESAYDQAIKIIQLPSDQAAAATDAAAEFEERCKKSPNFLVSRLMVAVPKARLAQQRIEAQAQALQNAIATHKEEIRSPGKP